MSRVLDGLVSKYDPAGAAADRYAVALRDLDEVYQQGAISIGQYFSYSAAAAFEKAEADAARFAAAVRKYIVPMAEGGIHGLSEELQRRSGARLGAAG